MPFFPFIACMPFFFGGEGCFFFFFTLGIFDGRQRLKHIRQTASNSSMDIPYLHHAHHTLSVPINPTFIIISITSFVNRPLVALDDNTGAGEGRPHSSITHLTYLHLTHTSNKRRFFYLCFFFSLSSSSNNHSCTHIGKGHLAIWLSVFLSVLSRRH